VNRGRVILLAALVVVTGTVIALQFRKPKTDQNQPVEWSANQPPSSGLPASGNLASEAPGDAPMPMGHREKCSEVSKIAPGMSSALAELDRKVFPITDAPAKPPSGTQTPTSTSRSTSSANKVPLVEIDSRVRSHCVADGDTLVRLAERYLGSADRSRELFEYNRDVLSSPNVLPIGKELRIPPTIPVQTADPLPSVKSTAFAPGSDSPPLVPLAAQKQVGSATAATSGSVRSNNPKQRTYTVQSGDNLVDIARKMYGDGRRHEQLFEANRHLLKNPASLKAGMVLVVP
jgi:nucleoid-associated protein YgaU